MTCHLELYYARNSHLYNRQVKVVSIAKSFWLNMSPWFITVVSMATCLGWLFPWKHTLVTQDSGPNGNTLYTSQPTLFSYPYHSFYLSATNAAIEADQGCVSSLTDCTV